MTRPFNFEIGKTIDSDDLTDEELSAYFGDPIAKEIIEDRRQGKLRPATASLTVTEVDQKNGTVVVLTRFHRGSQS